jgi:hypothetical protein
MRKGAGRKKEMATYLNPLNPLIPATFKASTTITITTTTRI